MSFKTLRTNYVTKPLFKTLKRKGLLPSISDTEKTALRAGSVWIEGELFSGKPDFERIFSYNYPTLSKEEQAFLDNEVEEVCAMTDDWEVFYTRDLPEQVWKYLKDKSFFGMIIPKEHGGLGFSAYGHSCVIEKLATCSQVLAITVMVPNSLGPAELLLRYGEENQKKYYLPRLANGSEIPCFALTEPEAGSDAAAIRSHGTIFKDTDGNLKIKLQFEKRYITLGAVATVIGLAFVCKDPENLLGRGVDLGITCALVTADKNGIDQSRRHDPMGVPFINAPLIGKDVIINLDDVIGGLEGIGKGWQMLMESLAVGRGISLPSTSTGGSKLAAFVASTYSVVRYQFGIAIGKFEGVAEVIGRLGAEVYVLDAAKRFTLGAIDDGEKPAVANAIMKYHSTEKFRKNIMDAMDIQGGAAIIMGPKNLLAHAYYGAPIAITVEGANIITRTLIQFGQGMIRCHPYAYAEIEAIEKEDIDAFDTYFFEHLSHIIRNMFRACILGISRGHLHKPQNRGITARYEQKLAWCSAKFACMSDIALGLMGSGMKKRESVSGRFADVLSQMYLLSATLKRFEAEGSLPADEVFLKVGMEEGFRKIDEAFLGIHQNLSGGLIGMLFRFKGYCGRINPMGRAVNDRDLHAVAMLLASDENVRNRVFSNMYRGGRIEELNEAVEMMFEARDVIRKRKKLGENTLSVEEKKILEKTDALQQNIIAVDSYTNEDYFRC
ncbi:acyl-CoA dehydrogenase [Sulfurovum sp. zt1-1]|uniref:Acyl-coenzyme A dehydrogenase n=1 Tax=Sulfurovum zhangzhouensis TaxID=3019067 RepID=A0ABT7QUY6_9BACT|nr:acyl-CoA dehydrogenase [Sulfurovum zhangzhouensis]MDM5270598.1 acyl-CoA dehydrogenase [Sulfurovum zhangzhouensis]